MCVKLYTNGNRYSRLEFDQTGKYRGLASMVRQYYVAAYISFSSSKR